MTKLILQRHPTDSAMIEVYRDRLPRSGYDIYAVVHEDCFWDDADIRAALETGNPVEVLIRLMEGDVF